jgi:hypothetical protein
MAGSKFKATAFIYALIYAIIFVFLWDVINIIYRTWLSILCCYYGFNILMRSIALTINETATATSQVT